MLRSLKEVQADDSVVGFYQATTLGAFFNQTLVDTQALHQEKLRHGGIVIVHGESIPGGDRRKRLRALISVGSSFSRFIENCPGKRVVPRIPVNRSLHGRIQEI